jgi:hypothetical protein
MTCDISISIIVHIFSKRPKLIQIRLVPAISEFRASTRTTWREKEISFYPNWSENWENFSEILKNDEKLIPALLARSASCRGTSVRAGPLSDPIAFNTQGATRVNRRTNYLFNLEGKEKFSRVSAQFMKNKTAATTLQALKAAFEFHELGNPWRVVSDDGGEFRESVDKFLEKTTSFTTVKHMIAKHMTHNQTTRWVDVLPDVMIRIIVTP